jgi:hypothetical protein
MSTGADSSAEKKPERMVSDEEPMTDLQMTYLRKLCREAGVEIDESLTKVAAMQKIGELQAKTGRGK